ncbi:MAG: sigma-70 family RNA polymerase sigma factor [Clostridiales bacterium]|nr:sigma-70 family RNA polymerase sigma factor [Clostridiales bacterium]
MGMFADAQAGDADALGSLVRTHMPLVQALARRFSFCEDAFQQGCLGLVHAIRHFREEMGRQFSTYAVPWILGEMRRAFSHTLGWRARAALKRAMEYQQRMQQQGREVTVGEMAAAAGIAREEMILLMERSQPMLYDESGILLPSLPDPQGESWLMRLCIRDILQRMPREERWIIEQRYMKGRSQTEVALCLKTTQSRISRREKLARQHFRQAWSE